MARINTCRRDFETRFPDFKIFSTKIISDPNPEKQCIEVTGRNEFGESKLMRYSLSGSPKKEQQS